MRGLLDLYRDRGVLDLRRRHPSVRHIGLAVVFHGWEMAICEAGGRRPGARAGAGMSAHERPGFRPAPETVLDRLTASLRGESGVARRPGTRGCDSVDRPASANGCRSSTSFLKRIEEYLVLGDYDPERRTGPAVWVRCVVDRTLDEPCLAGDRPPIIYLPGVARQDLRAGEECPDGLKPLVELLFRGGPVASAER